jgi:two-component system, NtrC family, sensor kinase
VARRSCATKQFPTSKTLFLIKSNTLKTTMSEIESLQQELATLRIQVEQLEVTEQALRKTQQRLQQTQGFLESVLNNLPVGVVAKEPSELRFVFCNPAAGKILGITEAALGKTDFELFPSEQATFFTTKDRLVLQSHQDLDISEREIQTVQGEMRVIHAKKTLVNNPAGEPEYLLAITEDITERKQAEQALQQSELQLRLKTQALEQALHNLKQTQVQLVQQEKMMSLGQLVAGVAHEINNPVNFIQGNLDYIDQYIQHLLQVIYTYQYAYPNPTEEIESLQQLIGFDFVLEDLPRVIESMRMGVTRIREFVMALRSFSRLDESELKLVDLHAGLDSTLLILENRLQPTANRPAISIKKHYGIFSLVECYAGQLNQVFMNLLTNAIEALDRKWTAPLAAESTETTAEMPTVPTIYLHTQIIEPGWIMIDILDNGDGVAESIQKQLFSPFVTTKSAGKGTGLGLAISHQIIVEQHKGHLRASSEPGQGAQFVIEIPIKQSQYNYQ